MALLLVPPDLIEPSLVFRFGVFFFKGGHSLNPLDIRFSKVSGISSSIDTHPHNEGGQNIYSQRLPIRGKYDNLILERSMEISSALVNEFDDTMTLFKFNPSNVLVTLFNENSLPMRGWLFMTAYPAQWKFSDLDAEQNKVMIETMELAYQSMQVVSL